MSPDAQSSPQASTNGGIHKAIGGASYNNTLYGFAVSNDHHLWVVSRTGSTEQWQWHDLGTPPGKSIIEGGGGGAAIVHNNTLSVFVIGSDQHLWENTWNGSTWQWHDRGAPPAQLVALGGAAVVHNNTLSVFIRDRVDHLWMTTLDSSTGQWQWHDHGTPPDVEVDNPVGAASYNNNLYLFFVSQSPIQSKDRHLWVYSFDGSTRQWQWQDQGTPLPNGTQEVFGGAGAVSDNNKLYAFVATFESQSNNQHLWVHSFDGSTRQWQWHDQGTPPGMLISDGGGVALHDHTFYAFVSTIGDENLWMNVWNGSAESSQWVNRGEPA